MEYRQCIPFSNYEVSECGQVRNIETKHVMSWDLNSVGYPRVRLTNAVGVAKNVLLHRLVFRTWKGEIPEGLVVDHIDEDKLNPHAGNLQLLTKKDNTVKSMKQQDCPTLVNEEGETLTVTRPLTDFSKKHGFNRSSLNKVLRGTYSHHQGWRLA